MIADVLLVCALCFAVYVFYREWRRDVKPSYKATLDPEVLARLHAEWQATADKRHFRTVTPAEFLKMAESRKEKR